jgi:hypothetical protein
MTEPVPARELASCGFGAGTHRRRLDVLPLSFRAEDYVETGNHLLHRRRRAGLGFVYAVIGSLISHKKVFRILAELLREMKLVPEHNAEGAGVQRD